MATAKLNKVLLADLQATERFGRCLADALGERTLIALSGQMGAGKTTLVKALAQGLGIHQVVSSPTFVIMNEYHGGRLPLYHLDLYRFAADELSEPNPPVMRKTEDPSVTYDLSFLAAEVDELRNAPGIVVIEWPEFFVINEFGKPSDFFAGRSHLKINLEYSQDQPDMRLANINLDTLEHTDPAKNLFNLIKDMLIYS